MSLSFRKSIRVGPLRFNLSKSGVGVSAGYKGFRIGAGPRGNYISFGRSGVSYKYSLPSWKKKAATSTRSNPPKAPSDQTRPEEHQAELPAATPHGTLTEDVVAEMVDSSSAVLIDEIESKLHRRPLGFYALLIAVVCWIGLAFWGFSIPWLIAFAVLLSILVAGAYFYDAMTRSVVLMYELDGNAFRAYERLYDCLLDLGKCGRVWRVQGTSAVQDSKYHSGMGEIVHRSVIKPAEKLPPLIKSNLPVVKLPLSPSTMYFFPDRIFIFSGREVGAVSYSDLEIQVTQSEFVEVGDVPHDARVVRHTWKFVNKDGTADRRFKDNKQIPVCLYEDIWLTSPNGLREHFQVSCLGLGERLSSAVKDLVTLSEG